MQPPQGDILLHCGDFHVDGPAAARLKAEVQLGGGYPTRTYLYPILTHGCMRPTQVEFDAKRRDMNAKLQANKTAPLVDAEVNGGRLYTGPMFLKYNSVLRGIKSEPDAHARKVN